MITVLEGPIGSGKTTLGKALVELAGAPLYRPFRGQRDDHTPGIGDPRLAVVQDLLPVNSWQEDMYVADVLAALKPHATLDRSLPSALAWENHDKPEQQMPLDKMRTLTGIWADRMREAGAMVVFIDAPMARKRKVAGTRFWEPEAGIIRGILDDLWSRVDGFKDILYRVNNDDAMPLNELAAEIAGQIPPRLLIERSWR